MVIDKQAKIIFDEETAMLDQPQGEGREALDREQGADEAVEKAAERMRELSRPETWEREIQENLEQAGRDLEFAKTSLQARVGVAEATGELLGAKVSAEEIAEAQEKMQQVRQALEKIKAMDLRQVSRSAAEGIKQFVKDNMLTLSPLLIGPLAALTGGSVGIAVQASLELTAGMYALDKVLDRLMDSAEEIIPPQYFVALVAGTTNLAELGTSQAAAFAGDSISEVASTPLGSNPTNLYLTGFALMSAMKKRAVAEGIIQPGEKLGLLNIKKVLKSIDWKSVKEQGGSASLFALDALIFQFYVRPEMKKANFIPFAAWSAINAPIMFEYFRRTTFSRESQVGNYAESIGEVQSAQLQQVMFENQEGASCLFELLESIQLYKGTEDKKERKELLAKLRSLTKNLQTRVEGDGNFRRAVQTATAGASMEDVQKFLKIAGVGEKMDVLLGVDEAQINEATEAGLRLGENPKHADASRAFIGIISVLESYKTAKTKEQKQKAKEKLEQAYYELDIEMQWDEEFAVAVENSLADEKLQDVKKAIDYLKTGKQSDDSIFEKIDNLGVLQIRNLQKFAQITEVRSRDRVEKIQPFVAVMSQIAAFRRAKNESRKKDLLYDIKLKLDHLERRGDLDEDFAVVKEQLLAAEEMAEIRELIKLRATGNELEDKLTAGDFKDASFALSRHQEVHAELAPKIGELAEAIQTLHGLKGEEKIPEVERTLRSQIKDVLSELGKKMQEAEIVEQEMGKILAVGGGEPVKNLIEMNLARQKKIKNVATIAGGIAALMGLSVVLDKGVTHMAESVDWLGKGAAGFFIMSFLTSVGEFLTTKKFFQRGEDRAAVKNIADSNAINIGLAKCAVASSAIRSLFV